MLNQKIVYIIHGWWGYPKEGWFPWLKKELEKRGFKVFIPKMPETGKPKINTWVSKLRKLAKKADGNTYFVGHSVGTQAIMRYLEKLPKNKKIGGAIFVAGWTSLTNLEPGEIKIAKPWLETKINFAKVKKSAKKFVAVFSDNDLYVPFVQNSKIFKRKLGAKIILEHKKGHFSGSDGVKKLPVVLSELMKMAK
ncbi:MAG: alpha/beta hydrolase [Candidatus Giovannonibacteria bacterium]|nr:MAG: alpha/beta hydrolase [Candidatus Giovannonibacteria bacterium]